MDPLDDFYPSFSVGSVQMLTDHRRRGRKQPLGFAPQSGGKPSKGTPADRRLKENKTPPKKGGKK